MKKNLTLCLLFALVLFAGCKKNEECIECVTECEECECEIPIDEDVLPTLEVPPRTDPKVVVLLYHNLVYGRTGDVNNRDIYNFEQDLIYIRKNFKVIDFYDLMKIQSGQMTLTSDAVIITFDDGDMSMYPLAFPLLKKYDFKATFFVVSSFVNDVGYLSWEKLSEIEKYVNPSKNKLFTIGSHTATHPLMGELNMQAVEDELKFSKQVIESKLGNQVDFVALPYGSGSDKVEIVEKAKALGYKGVRNSNVLAVNPTAIDMYHLPAFAIDNYKHDTFVEKVNALLGR